MARLDDRLARAKAYLAIAESKDSKREAYKRAANEIAAYKEATRATWASIAIDVGRAESTLKNIDKWRRDGCPGDSPFLYDGQATTRAAVSHTKAVLSDKTKTGQVEKILADLSDDDIERIEKVVSEEAVSRTVYADRPKPKYEDAKRKAAAGKASRHKVRPNEAADSFVALLGPARARIRGLCERYQDFLALVEDEEWRGYVREHLLAFQTDVNLALGEALEGSIDEALARLLEGEEAR